MKILSKFLKKDRPMEYQCEFVNHRSGPVNVYEFGRTMLTLAPGDERTVEMFDAGVTYAPFKRIEFKEDRVEIKRNPDWEPPWKDEFLTEFVNEDGSEIEALYLGTDGPLGQATMFYRGIPRILPVPVNHAFARFKRVTWKVVREKVPDSSNPGFLTWNTRLEMVKEERSKDELDRLEAAIKREAREKAEREIEKALKK